MTDVSPLIGGDNTRQVDKSLPPPWGGGWAEKQRLAPSTVKTVPSLSLRGWGGGQADYDTILPAQVGVRGLFCRCSLRNPPDPPKLCSCGSDTNALVGATLPTTGTHHTGTRDPSPPPPIPPDKPVGGWVGGQKTA